MPMLQTMLDDLPANPRHIARHLGIAVSTLASYRRANVAPRAILVALFWETSWGRSEADSEAANWGALHYQGHQMAKHEITRLHGIIARLEVELTQGGGAANAPVFSVR